MSPALVDIAKRPIIGFAEKDWDKVRASITPDFLYDEVATRRTVEGVAPVLAVWQDWAKAVPDLEATFHGAHASGNTVVIELTWKGTHLGPFLTRLGKIAPTGKRIELRSILVNEVKESKVASMRQYFDLATLLWQLGVR